jgi:hypothetical protein
VGAGRVVPPRRLQRRPRALRPPVHQAEVIERLKEMCSCMYCGAAAAPLKCSTCLATMYCNSTCSKKHWRRGGGVSEVCEAALPHKKTCPRSFDDPCG